MDNNYFLFLDDVRWPENVLWEKYPDDIYCRQARNYLEFIDIISNRGIPVLVSYDCDLHDEHYAAYHLLKEKYPECSYKFKNKCGIQCVEYMIKCCQEKNVLHPEYKIHTLNHYAKPFMNSLIQNYNQSKQS